MFLTYLSIVCGEDEGSLITAADGGGQELLLVSHPNTGTLRNTYRKATWDGQQKQQPGESSGFMKKTPVVGIDTDYVCIWMGTILYILLKRAKDRTWWREVKVISIDPCRSGHGCPRKAVNLTTAQPLNPVMISLFLSPLLKLHTVMFLQFIHFSDTVMHLTGWNLLANWSL